MMFFAFGTEIDSMVAYTKPFMPSAEGLLRASLNVLYWWWQGLAFAGFITYGVYRFFQHPISH
jgi:hypothetical protein